MNVLNATDSAHLEMTEPMLCEFHPEKRVQGVELSELEGDGPGRGGQGRSRVLLAWEGREG